MPRTTRHAALAATFCVLTGLGLITAAAPAQAASYGTVTGVVKDGTAPVGAGVVVTARTPADQVLATTTSGADGSYSLTGVPSGDRVICFDGGAVSNAMTTAGYLFTCAGGTSAATATPVHVSSGGTKNLDATLRRAFAVTGHVTGPGGSPAVGVTVQPSAFSSVTATTGADGTYRVTLDPQGFFDLRTCFHGSAGTGTGAGAGYLDTCSDQGGVTYPDPGRTYVQDQVLTPAAALAGRVTDYAGRPVSGVHVVVRSEDWSIEEDATSTADGSYRVDQLPGRTKVTISYQPTDDTRGPSTLGYSARCWKNATSRGGYCADATPVTTRAGALQTGFDAVLHAAGGVSGRVVDVMGRPIPQASVSVLGGVDGTQYTLTAADGTWSVGHLDPAAPHLACLDLDYLSPAWPDPDGYDSRLTCWHSSDGGSQHVPVSAGVVTRGIDFVPVGNGGIGGTAVDVTGAPLAGVAVEISDGDQSHGTFRTAADGTFRAGHLGVGRYQVCFETDSHADPQVPALGWVRQCSAIDVTDNATAVVPTATMVEGGGVSGTVTDTYGFTLDDVGVDLVNVKTGLPYTATVADGRYRIDSLAPGHYTVCFDPSEARRHRDGNVPTHGYAAQCWKKKDPGQPPTAVLVVGGASVDGVGAALKAQAAH